ncbi:MAG: hypothetical protein ACKVT0_09215 [Planctomycetaceae bacterium]
MLGRSRKTLRNRQILSIMVFVGVLIVRGVVSGQEVAIQQPVVSNFSVNTTVSVPDRGGIYLGGVGQAGNSRKSFGFSRPGTSTGTFTQGSSASAHVWIHDLDAMDQAALKAADTNSGNSNQMRSGTKTRLRSEVAHAAAHLRSRHAKKSSSSLQGGVSSEKSSIRSRELKAKTSHFSTGNPPRKLSDSSDKRAKR